MKYLLRFKAAFQYIFLVLSGLILLISSFLLALPIAQARNTSVENQRAGSAKSVTVLILDMSGSMSENDPRGYRCSAADAFIDMSGPGNYIGVIGLDGNPDVRGGQHNFALAQEWTPDPVDMSVLSERNGLKATIQQKSHNCAPDSITPTYDALNKALQMLEDTAGSNEIPGSVILLTDGEPDDGSPPDVAAQINGIETDLLPQFRQHNWPIDTVALGQNAPVSESGTQFATFHDFLQGVSNATGGVPYDDARGVVPGNTPNALNIAPFFADIFARHNGRTLKNDIGATSLAGAGNVVKSNFNVTPYTTHLDIIVVKDQPGTQVTLRDANNNLVTPQAGIALYQGTYYVIFSIDDPQPGVWELDVQGTGQFLMESLKETTLTLAPLSVSQNGLITTGTSQSFASGQTLTVKTSLLSQGQTVIDPTTYTALGTIAYNGIAGTYSQNFTLHGDSSGTYTGTVTIPSNRPTGTYIIEVNISTGSLDNVLTSGTLPVRIGVFPLPLFLAPNGFPTSNPVSTQIVQWDPILNVLYSLPMPAFLSQWALQGYSVGRAVLSGEVTLRNQVYSGATISAVVVHQGSNSSQPVSVQMGNNGKFSVMFPVTTSGVYTLYFNTSGTFADSHGDFGTTRSVVNLTIVPPDIKQEILAWVLTIVYLWLLICLVNLFRYMALGHPFGGYIQSQDGDIVGRFAFKRARRNPFQAYFRPDRIYSQQVLLPAGLVFRFKHRGGIEVHPQGPDGRNWQSADGGRLREQYQEARELRYVPPGMDADDEEMLRTAVYTIQAKFNGRSDEDADTESLRPQPSKGRKKTYTSSSARSRKKSRLDNDYDDYYPI